MRYNGFNRDNMAAFWRATRRTLRVIKKGLVCLDVRAYKARDSISRRAERRT